MCVYNYCFALGNFESDGVGFGSYSARLSEAHRPYSYSHKALSRESSPAPAISRYPSWERYSRFCPEPEFLSSDSGPELKIRWNDNGKASARLLVGEFLSPELTNTRAIPSLTGMRDLSTNPPLPAGEHLLRCFIAVSISSTH